MSELQQAKGIAVDLYCLGEAGNPEGFSPGDTEWGVCRRVAYELCEFKRSSLHEPMGKSYTFSFGSDLDIEVGFDTDATISIHYHY